MSVLPTKRLAILQSKRYLGGRIHLLENELPGGEEEGSCSQRSREGDLGEKRKGTCRGA